MRGMFEITFTPEVIDDLHDIDEGTAVVKIEAVGHKSGNRLFIRGEEFQL
jgi:hypothetical protein